jgi:hypothetical protein
MRLGEYYRCNLRAARCPPSSCRLQTLGGVSRLNILPRPRWIPAQFRVPCRRIATVLHLVSQLLVILIYF